MGFGFGWFGLVSVQSMQRLFQEMCRDHLGGLSDCLGVTLEAFWEEIWRKQRGEKPKRVVKQTNELRR